jgi:hypothetical protein
MLLGVALAAAGAWRDWRRRAELGPMAFLLLMLVVAFLGTSAGLRMSYDKYYLPILIWGTVFGGLAVGWLIGGARQLVQANTSAQDARRSTANTLMVRALRQLAFWS